MKTYITDSATLSAPRFFTRGRLAFLVLGLLVPAATSMAEVTYDSATGTFTGDGTFSEAVDATISLTATPTAGQSITFTGNIVSTGNFTQSGADVVFGSGTVNSFNALYINNGSVNGAKMTLNGSMTLAELHVANVMTTFLDITDGAALSVSGKAWINEARSAQGIITQTGGTVSFTTSGATDVRIGHWPNTDWPSRYDISGGSLSVPNTTTYVGWDGYAEMNIRGGEVSLKCLSLSNSGGGKGTLRLTSGTLNVGDGGVVRNSRGASGPAAAEVYLGQGTINATANQTWGNNLTMTLTGRSAEDTADVEGGVTTFNAGEGKAITIPSVIAGVGALTKIGAGTLTLSGANTYTGATTISGGTLELTGSGALGTGAVSVAAGTTLKFNYSADKTLTNAISGAGKITKEGTNTVKLDGAFSSYTGDMTINGGKVSILANGSTKKVNVAKLSGSGDLELRLASGNSDTQLVNLVNDHFTGVISLVQEGGASSNKVYTNTQTFEDFNLKVNNGTSIFISGSEFKGNVQIAGNGNSENRGSLRIASKVSGNISLMADANISFQGAQTISGSITSAAASGETTLFINGKTDGTTVTANRDAGTYTGTLSDGTSGGKLGIRIVSNPQTFSGTLSYTGATTVNVGTTMNLSGANANLKNSRAVTLNGTLNFSNYTGSSAMQINDLSGTTATSAVTGMDKNLILNNENNTSYVGNIRIGSGTLTKTGAGKLTLSGVTAYSGTTTVSGGTLDLTQKDAIAHSSAVVNNAAITASEDQTFRNLSGSGSVTVSNKNVTLVSPAGSAYSGTITGVKTLAVETNSAYDLSGATVSAASFEVKPGASVNVSSAKPITVTESFRQGNDAKFTFSGGNAAISGANVAEQAAITLNGGTMSINSYDFTAPTLPEISSLTVHLDASDASSFDNSSSITTWKNLANPSNSLTFQGYGGSTSHAYVTEGGQNGLNVMTFPANGTAYYNMASVVNGQTFFAVMSDNGNTAPSDYSFLFGNNSNGAVNGHNPYCFHRGAGTVLWNTSHLDGNIKTSGVTSLNGTAVAHADANIGTGWNVLSIQATGTVPVSAISRERTNLTAARGWRGDIAEILVYTEALTDEQVKAVSEYLATKWNVGNDVVEPTVVSTGSFVSANTIHVTEDSAIDVGGFTSVTFGSTSIDGGKTLTINVAEDQTTAWETAISGEGGFTKAGAGTLTLTQAHSYTGATTVEAGTLGLTEGGTLYNLSGGSATQAANIDAAGKNLALVSDDDTKFTGTITAASITKSGNGTLRLNTGDGTITASSLTVSQGRLDLHGKTTGGLTVNTGTIFSPGNSVGTAEVGGTFKLETDGILLLEQDASGMDLLKATSFDVASGSIDLEMGAVKPGAKYPVIQNTSGAFGPAYDTAFWTSLLDDTDAYYWILSVEDNTVYATIDAGAVPEPSTWLLLLLGTVGLLYWRKK